MASFQDDLEQSSLNITALKEKEYLSRYDVARLLNFAVCEDCLVEHPSWDEKYSLARWETISNTIGYDVTDIAWSGALYEGEDYFACVARVVDQ